MHKCIYFVLALINNVSKHSRHLQTYKPNSFVAIIVVCMYLHVLTLIFFPFGSFSFDMPLGIPLWCISIYVCVCVFFGLLKLLDAGVDGGFARDILSSSRWHCSTFTFVYISSSFFSFNDNMSLHCTLTKGKVAKFSVSVSYSKIRFVETVPYVLQPQLSLLTVLLIQGVWTRLF